MYNLTIFSTEADDAGAFRQCYCPYLNFCLPGIPRCSLVPGLTPTPPSSHHYSYYSSHEFCPFLRLISYFNFKDRFYYVFNNINFFLLVFLQYLIKYFLLSFICYFYLKKTDFSQMFIFFLIRGYIYRKKLYKNIRSTSR